MKGGGCGALVLVGVCVWVGKPEIGFLIIFLFCMICCLIAALGG